MSSNEALQNEIVSFDKYLSAYRTRTPDFLVKIDSPDSTTTYIGKAVPGTATSAALWQIKKIDTTSGTSIAFASGNSNFDKVFDNRASLTYS